MKNKSNKAPFPKHDLDESFSTYSHDFSDQFVMQVMKTVNDENISLQKVENVIWRRGFYKIAIPAAALVVVLLGISFSIDSNLNKDSIFGISEVVDNQIELVFIQSNGF